MQGVENVGRRNKFAQRGGPWKKFFPLHIQTKVTHDCASILDSTAKGTSFLFGISDNRFSAKQQLFYEFYI